VYYWLSRDSCYSIHLLYCDLKIVNRPGNRYDALLPIISVINNPPVVNVTANTQSNVSGDTDNDLPFSKGALVSDPDSIFFLALCSNQYSI